MARDQKNTAAHGMGMWDHFLLPFVVVVGVATFWQIAESKLDGVVPFMIGVSSLWRWIQMDLFCNFKPDCFDLKIPDLFEDGNARDINKIFWGPRRKRKKIGKRVERQLGKEAREKTNEERKDSRTGRAEKRQREKYLAFTYAVIDSQSITKRK
jgi:hypothetical protein